VESVSHDKFSNLQDQVTGLRIDFGKMEIGFSYQTKKIDEMSGQLNKISDFMFKDKVNTVNKEENKSNAWSFTLGTVITGFVMGIGEWVYKSHK
jgi:hypothetical protein